MNQFLTELPNTFLGWVTVIGLVVTGAFALFGVFDKMRRGREDEADENGDRLISILQGTVEQLEKKVNKQTADIEELTGKVNLLSKENETLIKILQGKDERTIAIYKKIDEIHERLTK